MKDIKMTKNRIKNDTRIENVVKKSESRYKNK